MRRLILTILLIIFGIAQLSAQISEPFTGSSGQPEDQSRQSDGGDSGKARYIFYSLLIPGAGQWKMDHSGRAKFFLGTDLLLWLSLFGSYAYADVVREDYIAYATLHAGSNSRTKGDQYWIDVGSSDNIYQHNADELRNRNLKGLYPENSLYYWQWDHSDSRKTYNNLRVSEHEWESRATFVVGALILNRLISAVDVLRLIRKEKRQSGPESSRWYFDYQNTRWAGDIMRLNFQVTW